MLMAVAFAATLFAVEQHNCWIAKVFADTSCHVMSELKLQKRWLESLLQHLGRLLCCTYGRHRQAAAAAFQAGCMHVVQLWSVHCYMYTYM